MLIVVDMQPVFSASEFVLDAVIKEVKRAKKRNEWIFLLEYRHNGRTMYRLTKHLRKYKKVIRIVKSKDDGSSFVLQTLMEAWRNKNLSGKHLKTIPRSFRVVGVNTNACVLETVQGMNRLDGSVTVVSSACANYCDDCKFGDSHVCQQHHNIALRSMARLKNVKVI